MEIKTKLPGIELKNPVMPASGCFSLDFNKYYDLSILGAYVTKAITLEERIGNPPPRVIETPSGMLNSIGLQNPGAIPFIEDELPQLMKLGIPIIANVAGKTEEEYIEVCRILSNTIISAIELNISCPNVKQGGITFGTDPHTASMLVSKVKAVSKVPVYVKLTPNVTSIVEMAKAVKDAGADALSMINTLLGMDIDTKTGLPYLANITGGLSGPAIRPVAIRMIYEVSNSVNIPIIGIGGISNTDDVIKFLYAGASAVQIGTSNFTNQYICRDIINELPRALEERRHESLAEIIGYTKRKLKK
jgi:dihydroorotate dehydrogenase (NAD+) catalytic subunit